MPRTAWSLPSKVPTLRRCSSEPTTSAVVSGLRVAGEPAEFGATDTALSGTTAVTVAAGGAVRVGVELHRTAEVDAGGAHAAVEVHLSATGADDVMVALGTIRLATAGCLPVNFQPDTADFRIPILGRTATRRV